MRGVSKWHVVLVLGCGCLETWRFIAMGRDGTRSRWRLSESIGACGYMTRQSGDRCGV